MPRGPIRIILGRTVQDNLKKSAVSGMAWTGAERLATQVLRFFISLVMARLLAPSDYGVVGMLAIFLAIAGTFQDSGFAAALIQKKDKTEVDYSTAFFFNLAVAMAFYGVLFAAAPLIAHFYKVPDLVSITRVVALGLIINAFSVIQQTRLTINLKFGTLAILSVLSVLVSSTIGITLAYRGYGAWALVWQSVLGGAINTLILWCVARWHPLLMFSVESFRKLFGFGSKLLYSSLINTIYGNLYTLVIGRVFGPAEVGHFNRANGFAALPADTLTDMVLKVNYPILVRFQDDTLQLITAYRRLLRTPMFLLVPVLFGMAAVAEPMVCVLIGEKWLPCVPFLQVLCFGLMWNPLTHINLNLLYVKGRTDLVLKLELIKKPIAFLILFSMIPFGIFWLCVGKAAYDFIAFCFNCHYTNKVLGYGFWRQIKEIIPMVANALAMVLIVTWGIGFFDSNVAKLTVGVLIGMGSYLLGAVIYREESLRYAWNMIRRRT